MFSCLLHVFFCLVFTELLYSFRLCYYIWPPLLMQTWHGVDFVCFICTQDSHHVTTTPTNQVMMKGATTTTTSTHTHILYYLALQWDFFIVSFFLFISNIPILLIKLLWVLLWLIFPLGLDWNFYASHSQWCKEAPSFQARNFGSS